jgi:hypothetical protein
MLFVAEKRKRICESDVTDCHPLIAQDGGHPDEQTADTSYDFHLAVMPIGSAHLDCDSVVSATVRGWELT